MGDSDHLEEMRSRTNSSSSTSSSKGSSGLYRSQSDANPISIRQRIKQFERISRADLSITNSLGTRRYSSMRIGKSRSEGPGAHISSSTDQTNHFGQRRYASMRITKVKEDPIPQITQDVSRNVIVPAVSMHKDNRNGINSKHFINWTQAGFEKINPIVRDRLERDLFYSEILESACLATRNGEILCTSSGCGLTSKELKIILKGMQNREYFTSSRIQLSGHLYSCMSATDRILRARRAQGKHWINCTGFKQCLLISFFNYPILPKQIANLIQHIEKFISEYGY